jgi:D-serine deaminase-like pyridoxal phosphate-dependent protein
MQEFRRGQELQEIETPALVLDIGRAERNIARMAKHFAGRTTRLRPHVKTHKTPLLAHKQLAAGAIGITCAKLGEAEVMVAAGIREILLSSEIAGAAKIARLITLNRHARVITVIDDIEAARAISDAALAAGVCIDALIDLDVGQGRTGVQPGAPALVLSRAALQMKGLNLVGLQGYEGHAQHLTHPKERAEACHKAMKILVDTADRIRADGVRIELVTTGGTGTHAFAGDYPGVTEIQPGSYVVMDSHYGTVQGLEFEHALTILSTVISKTRPDAAVLDAGLKTASCDSGMPVVSGMPGAQFFFAGDEHGKVLFGEPRSDIRVGDKIELIPSHCDTTINLHDVYHVVRAGRLEDVWPIAARGKIQ